MSTEQLGTQCNPDYKQKSRPVCLSKSMKTSERNTYPKKTGDLNINNFKPISILPTCQKFVVHDQILNHLIQFNLLPNYQSGFRPGFSTQDVLIHMEKCGRQ